MSRIGSYTQKNFTPAVKLLAYDSDGSTTALVPGQSLLDYIGFDDFVQELNNRVEAIRTTDVAVTEDLPVGRVIYTTGVSVENDGGGGHYVVVIAGTGGIPMDNGNELLLLPIGDLSGSDATNANVTTSTNTQTLQGALDSRVIGVSVQTFDGVDPTGLTDSTDGLRAAIASGFPLDWGYGAIYSISDDIGNNFAYESDELNWHGQNVTIRNDSATQIQNMCKLRLLGQRGYVGAITFDCSLKSTRGLTIENDSPDMSAENTSDLVLERTRVVNPRRSSTGDTGGDGVYIRGGFSSVALIRASASNCVLATGAGVPGISGMYGFTVTHFGVSGYVRKCILDVDVDSVYSEDTSYTVDQDGARVFAPHVESGGVPVDTYLEVPSSASFRNCWGRSIKSQMFDNNVSGRYYRDDGFDGKEGNGEIELQISGGTVSNMKCFYSGGYRPSEVVSCSSSNDSGTPYQINAFKIDGVKVYLDNFGSDSLSRVVSSFPGGGYVGPISVKRVDVYGGAVEKLALHRVNGDLITNKINISECYIEEFSPDVTTGNRALLQVISSGGDSPYSSRAEINDCVYGGSETVYIAEDTVSGGSMRVDLSATRNLGFVDDRSERPGEGGTKSNQVARIGAIGPSAEDDNTLFIGSHRIQTISLAASETGSFSVRMTLGALILMTISSGEGGVAIFSASNSGLTSISTGADVALGNTSNPGTGDYNVWVSSANELSVENTTGGTDTVTIWALLNGL